MATFISNGEPITSPSPQYDIPIVANNGVLKVSPNMYGGTYYSILVATSKAYSPIAIRGDSWTADGTRRGIAKIVKVKPNTTYTFSYSSMQGANLFNITEYARIEDMDNYSNALKTGDSTTFTTSANTNYLLIGVWGYPTPTAGTVLSITNPQLELGSTATTYRPYGSVYYDGTVETVQAHGKNLFDRATVGIEDGAIASATGKNAGSSSRCRTIGYVPVNPNTTYTISAVINGYAGSNSAGIFVLEYTASSGYTGTYSGWQNPSGYSFTTGATTYGIRLVFGWSISGEISPSDISNIQLELGSTATPYEPYYNGGTATAQPLLKVGDYQDVQSVLDGQVTRNVGIKVLTGTEEGWSRNSDRASLLIPDILNGSNSWMPICTHYKTYHGGTSLANMDDNSCKITSGGKSLLIKDTTHNTSLTDFTDYIKAQYNAGFPVILVYPLATPTTETVTGQPLTIQAGTNIVEITQASIDNLELEVSYKAGVAVTVEEIEAVNNDESVEVTING